MTAKRARVDRSILTAKRAGVDRSILTAKLAGVDRSILIARAPTVRLKFILRPQASRLIDLCCGLTYLGKVAGLGRRLVRYT